MGGLVAYGTYIPYWRLDRAEITATLRTGGGRGTRAVASFDEDTTTMGVEAARACLAAAPAGLAVGQVLFVTADPAYLDKANATAIHAALGLDRSALAFDLVGSVSSVSAALAAAAQAAVPTLVVTADIRNGLPGGADESNGGDAAAAYLYDPSTTEPIVEVLGTAGATREFLDRWRSPGDATSKVWEERFGEHAYVPLAEEAVAAALKDAGLTADDVDHAIVTGLHARAARVVAGSIGVRREALADDLSAVIGNSGAAQQGVATANVLDTADAGKVLLQVSLSDGAMAVVSRTTGALKAAQARQPRTVAAQVASGRADLSYASFLTWRGQLHREPPRRPDPTAPAAPPSLRGETWKFGFNASRCTAFDTRHLPPAQVCVRCGAIDQMTRERLADVPGTVATYTVDNLAFTPNPPMVAAVIDFDGGGRFRCEVTDVDPAAVEIGDRVEMTFRRISTVNGVHNYFWKARPIREIREGSS